MEKLEAEKLITYNNFNDKAEIYAKTRASYTNNYINIFCRTLVSQHGAIIADVAAGTGIHTKQISKFCSHVYVVEPNNDMLNQCKKHCEGIGNLTFLGGTSDQTQLESQSVNIITIAQAFQLLDMERTRKECQRILKPNGKVILLWNSKEYRDGFFYDTEEILLEFCPVYKRNIHALKFSDHTFDSFFVGKPEFHKFLNDGNHYITKDEFIGRALCASYSLQKDDSNYQMFINCLAMVFDKHAKNNLVYAPLSTIIYVGDV